MYSGTSTVNGDNWKEELRIENSHLVLKDHIRDFFILGSNAWLLVSHKFGCDREVLRKGVLKDRSVQIRINNDLTISLPESGHFGYTAILKNQPNYLSDEETVTEDDLVSNESSLESCFPCGIVSCFSLFTISSSRHLRMTMT